MFHLEDSAGEGMSSARLVADSMAKAVPGIGPKKEDLIQLQQPASLHSGCGMRLTFSAITIRVGYGFDLGPRYTIGPCQALECLQRCRDAVSSSHTDTLSIVVPACSRPDALPLNVQHHWNWSSEIESHQHISCSYCLMVLICVVLCLTDCLTRFAQSRFKHLCIRISLLSTSNQRWVLL